MNNQTMTVGQALSLIDSKIMQGLTPVMAGTRFYRHSFQPSELGHYVWYLDERGTRGCFRPENVERVLDFIDLGKPQVLEDAVGLGVAVVEPEVQAPTLLEAAEDALMAMEVAGVSGPVMDRLATAIAAERRNRVH